MRCKPFLYIFFVFIFSILFFDIAYAISISTFEFPNPILFEPNMDFTIDVWVAGYGNDAIVDVGGELLPYATISKITEQDKTKSFNIRIQLPQDMDPGLYTITISAKDVPFPSGAAVGGVAVVQRKFKIKVFNNSKSIDPTLYIPDLGNNETAPYWVKIKSVGKFHIDQVSATVLIYHLNGTVAKTLASSFFSLSSGTTIQIDGLLNATGLEVGDHRAKAVVMYDGEQKTVEVPFRVGSLHVFMDDFTKNLSAATIDKFHVTVRSGWSNDIKNVYAEITIGDIKTKTPIELLSPFETKQLETYIDTNGLSIGNHEAQVTLYYDGGVNSATGMVTIIEKTRLSSSFLSMFSHPIIVVIAVIILLLILFNLFLIYRYFNRDRSMQPIKKKNI